MSMQENRKIDVIPMPISTLAQESGFYAQGLLVAYAMQWNNGILNKYYNFHKVEMFVREDISRIKKELISNNKDAIYLYTLFDWTQELSVDVARIVRQISPGSINMAGGPSVPNQLDAGKQFINRFQCFDLAAFAEGEETFAELLYAIALQSIDRGLPIRSTNYNEVLGVLWRADGMEPMRNERRPQIKDVNTIPSPYLSGVFKEPFAQYFIAYTETNRGCPFSCSYCDWGSSTQSKFRLFDEKRIMDEMQWISSRKFIHYYPTDSNFGAFKRDVDIAKFAVKLKETTGYPTSFATNYAKNVADRVVDIAEILFDGKMLERFSVPFQTIDTETLKNIDRDNIKISSFDRMIARLREKWIPVTTEVLLGLPGQSYEKFKIDLQYFFDRLINPTVYQVSVLPNAPMADHEYMDKYGIKMDDKKFVIATSSFTEEEHSRMRKLRLAGMLFIHEKFLIYYLIYCQLEFGLNAIDVIDNILFISETEEKKYPLVAWAFNNMMDYHTETGAIIIGWDSRAQYIFENIDGFYREINELVSERFNISIERDDLNSLIALQILVIDRVNKKPPLRKWVARDVVGYFGQLKEIPILSKDKLGQGFRPLRDFAAGEIVIPEQRKKRQYSFVKVTTERVEWPFSVEGLFV